MKDKRSSLKSDRAKKARVRLMLSPANYVQGCYLITKKARLKAEPFLFPSQGIQFFFCADEFYRAIVE
jgi:hypothetical protein